MMTELDDKLANLVQAYLTAWHRGEFDSDPDEVRYRDLILERQDWLRKNILDLEKLRGYSDAEFTERFYEMIDNTEGGGSGHARVKGNLKKYHQDVTTLRKQFENAIAFITSPQADHFAALEQIEDKNSEYKIKGLGPNSLTALVNAKYPDVPIVNGTTEIFCKSIGYNLPKTMIKKQRAVHDLFAKMVEGANGEIDFIDANHICWYTQKVDSGIEFMKINFPTTYIEPVNEPRKSSGRARRRKLTPEEQYAENLRRLQAIHDQAERERASKVC